METADFAPNAGTHTPSPWPSPQRGEGTIGNAPGLLLSPSPRWGEGGRRPGEGASERAQGTLGKPLRLLSFPSPRWGEGGRRPGEGAAPEQRPR